MTNIVVRQEISPKLSEYDKTIIEAQDSELVSDMNSLDISSHVAPSIIQANNLILGHKPKEDDDIGAIALQVGNKLADSRTSRSGFSVIPQLRIDEVKIAILRGAFGDYKDESDSRDVLHLSARNVIAWIKAYQETRTHALIAQKKYEAEKNRLLEDENSVKRQIEYYETLSDKIKVEYENYKNGKVGNLAWLYSRSLEDIGLINITEPLKKKLEEESIQIVTDQIKAKKKNPLRVGLENIKKTAINVGRRLALHNWFDMMEAKGEDIVKSVNQKSNEYITNNIKSDL